MSLGSIGVVYGKELLDSLRDRRTLISMVVVPVLIMPLLVLGMGLLTARTVVKARQEVPAVMVLGGEDSPGVMARLRNLGTLHIVPAGNDVTNQIVEKKIRAAVRMPPGFEAGLSNGAPSEVEILIYQGEIKSGFAAETIRGFFRDLREQAVEKRLAERNLPPSLLKPFEVETHNVAPPKKVAGNILGGILPYMVILLCLLGAMYPAMDLTAGEKERGTMETILCSPVSRTHLVLGKFLTVLTASAATAVLALGSSAGTLALTAQLLKSMAPGKAVELPLTLDLGNIVLVLLMILPVAVFFAAAQLAVALFARSFKEAQTYLSPLMFVVILPAMASMTPGIELDVRLALIPVLNTSLVSKEILTGTYHWGYISLIFGSSVLYAALALGFAVRLFNREEVVFRV